MYGDGKRGREFAYAIRGFVTADDRATTEARHASINSRYSRRQFSA
jgi:hypothetical protein